jgi:hypothetical protein
MGVMTPSTTHPVSAGVPPSVAVAGTDDWLSRRFASRLAETGLVVRHLGTGSSSLHRVDTLVLVPRLVPQSANPARDVGLAQCGITLAAGALGGVEHVVLASLVGSDPSGPGHLGALGRLEAMVLASGLRVTIIRATQVYGAANDPGPFIERIHHALSLQPTRLESIEIEPVFVNDAVEAVEAAVYCRVPPETFELAGRRKVKVSEFVQKFDRDAHLGQTASVTRRVSKRPSKRRATRALGDLLESQPAAIRHARPRIATDHEQQPVGTSRPRHAPIEAA